MQPHNGTIFLRLLLNKYFTGKPDTWASLMPQEDQEKLSTISLEQKEPNLMLFLPKRWLTSMDPSWILPIVEKLSKPLQEVYARAFPQIFGNATDAPLYNETIQEFLINYLHNTWTEDVPVPKELLPESEFSELLTFSRKELLELIDLLSMHDLVEEMRRIVDKRLLQSVLQYLTKEQQHYLRILLRQQSRQVPSAISISELLKEEKNFAKLLHKFGLKRLSLALSGASNECIWHLMHTLDVARAKFVENHVQKEEVPNHTSSTIANTTCYPIS